MSQETNYFKLGIFSIATLVLLVVIIVILGSGNLFTKYLTVETYFDDTVQGLAVGSPVKFRGVTIGKVDDIEIAGSVYGKGGLEKNGKEQHYIYVKFSITSQGAQATSTEQAAKIIQQTVKQGLRVNLATQDLVGNVFLELNFTNPSKNPVLPISWTPKYTYIPSTPSTLSRFTDSIDAIFTSLSSIDFKKIADDFDDFTVTANTAVKQAQLGQLSKNINEALVQINKLAKQVNDVIQSPKSKDLSDSIYKDAKLLESTLQQTSATMSQLNSLISRTNEFSASQQQTIIDTLSNLKQMSSSLQSLSTKVDNNPSTLIFSQPTQPMDLSK